MIRKSIFTAVICLFMAASIIAQTEKPLQAELVIAKAYDTANQSGKNVFLLFHATWCSWCKRLDKVMQSNEMKEIFERNFVVTHLDVMESGAEIEKSENPGGKAVMNVLGGAKSGIPFYAFLTPEGKNLANSNAMEKNGNIGYPGTLEEIQAFMKLLKTGAPNMSENDYNAIFIYLKKNAPKPIE